MPNHILPKCSFQAVGAQRGLAPSWICTKRKVFCGLAAILLLSCLTLLLPVIVSSSNQSFQTPSWPSFPDRHPQFSQVVAFSPCEFSFAALSLPSAAWQSLPVASQSRIRGLDRLATSVRGSLLANTPDDHEPVPASIERPAWSDQVDANLPKESVSRHIFCCRTILTKTSIDMIQIGNAILEGTATCLTVESRALASPCDTIHHERLSLVLAQLEILVACLHFLCSFGQLDLLAQRFESFAQSLFVLMGTLSLFPILFSGLVCELFDIPFPPLRYSAGLVVGHVGCRARRVESGDFVLRVLSWRHQQKNTSFLVIHICTHTLDVQLLSPHNICTSFNTSSHQPLSPSWAYKAFGTCYSPVLDRQSMLWRKSLHCSNSDTLYPGLNLLRASVSPSTAPSGSTTSKWPCETKKVVPCPTHIS